MLWLGPVTWGTDGMLGGCRPQLQCLSAVTACYMRAGSMLASKCAFGRVDALMQAIRSHKLETLP